MKKNILSLILFITLKSVAQEDYSIKIDGEVFSIALNKPYSLDIKGKKIDLMLSLKDTLFYNDELYNFFYTKDYTISKTVVDTGIQQITIITAEGNGIVVQKFSNLNPTQLNEIMLTEITKESVNYGYVLERKDYKRTIKSGQVIQVNKAVLKYKDETNIYEVASIGKKDEGILIMTMQTDTINNSQGLKIINLFWDSIYYK